MTKNPVDKTQELSIQDGMDSEETWQEYVTPKPHPNVTPPVGTELPTLEEMPGGAYISTQSVTVGQTTHDVPESTMELDVSALALGLERPAQKATQVQHRSTVAVQASSIHKLVNVSSQPTGEASAYDIQAAIESISSDLDDADDWEESTISMQSSDLEARLAELEPSPYKVERPSPSALRRARTPQRTIPGEDRTVEADAVALMAMSRSMMSVEPEEKERRTSSVDVREMAARLSQERQIAAQRLAGPEVTQELNAMALDLATEVVERRVTHTEPTTLRGDMRQLAAEISARVAVEQQKENLDPSTRDAMEQLAFQLAAHLEQEALDLAIQIDVDTFEPDTSELINIDEDELPEVAPMAYRPALDDFDPPTSPSRPIPALSFDTIDTNLGGGVTLDPIPVPSPAIEHHAAEPEDHGVGEDATMELRADDPAFAAIAADFIRKQGHAPAPPKPIDIKDTIEDVLGITAPEDLELEPSIPLSLDPEIPVSSPSLMPTPAQRASLAEERKNKSNKTLMIIVTVLIFLIAALITTAAVIYFTK